MEEEIKKTELKLYIENDIYYLYEAFCDDTGNYLYASKDNSKKQNCIMLGNINSILIEYLNLDFSFINNIIDDFFTHYFTKINKLFDDLFIKIQSETNYIYAVLILNKLFEYLDMSGTPGFSTILLETFTKKLNTISSFINAEEISEKFDFDYIKNIDMDNFEDDDIYPDTPTIFKALVKFIFNEHELNKIFFKCLVNNNVNILELTSFKAITNIKYEILPNLKKDSTTYFIEIYSINDLTTFLYFAMLQIQKRNMIIRTCNTCNKFFIPNDNRQIYCSKYCNTKHFDSNTKDDPIGNLYRSTYKLQNKKKNEYKNSRKNMEENWNIYKNELKNQKDRCKTNEITLAEFKEWINNNKDWFLCNTYKPR